MSPVDPPLPGGVWNKCSSSVKSRRVAQGANDRRCQEGRVWTWPHRDLRPIGWGGRSRVLWSLGVGSHRWRRWVEMPPRCPSAAAREARVSEGLERGRWASGSG